MLVGVRDRLIRNRTQLANSIRGHAAEFGLTPPRGFARSSLCSSASRPTRRCPSWRASCSPCRAAEYAQLQQELEQIEARLMAWHRADECSRRLAQIPSVGPIGASLLTMKTPVPEASDQAATLPPGLA